MGRLDAKVAIVTASTRGIGRAIADRYADEGAAVYYAVRNPRRGAKAVEAAVARGGKAAMVYFEAHDYNNIENMIDEVLAKEGRIDVLVNNFGGSDPSADKDFINATWDAFSKTVETHLASVFIASQCAIKKAMIPQKSGSIINIGSVAGVVPDLTQCGYGVSKAAIEYLTKQIAVQTGRYNIRANVIHPGIIATDAVRNYLPAAVQETYLSGYPIHRLGEPAEVAELAVYLASDLSAYVTGQSIRLCGGTDICTPIYASSLQADNMRM